MNSKIYKTVARYLLRLGLAIIGKDYMCSDVCAELNERVEKADADLKRLKEMYNVALGKWKADDVLVKKLFCVVARREEEISSYQKLVEALRSSIGDKQAIIDAYAQAEQNNESGK